MELWHFPNQSIIKWIRNYAKILKELIIKATIAEIIQKVEILKMNELFFHIAKKQNRIICVACCGQKPEPNSRTLSWILRKQRHGICRRIDDALGGLSKNLMEIYYILTEILRIKR